MTFGGDARLVDPGVQGGVIDVVDLLARCHVMVKLDGIGTSTTEGVRGIERFHELQGIHVHSDVGTGLFEVDPFAFPHFLDVVPFGVKLPHFLLGFVVDILHGAITKTQMGFVPHGNNTWDNRARSTRGIHTQCRTHDGNHPQ